MSNESAKDHDAPLLDDAAPDATRSGAVGRSSTLRIRDDAAFCEAPGEVPIAAEAEDHLPRVGQVVAGKYRIEEQLGRGGMGVVYRATHLVSEKQVAIKWMLRSASSESRQRFLREARVAARIEHPNVVDVYDIGQAPNSSLYLVMQLLRGETLGSLIARGPLGIAETIELLIPAMRGVAALHQAGVVHRDLKPDNIFLCQARPGVRGETKVLDFGVSAMIGDDRTEQVLTADGAAVGTPAYMSPEQLSDSRNVDTRTDVYSFGVILYEALTGALPFRADSYNGLVLAPKQASAGAG